MAGAVLFKSGIAWTAGSLAFDHIMTLISARFEDDRLDAHLRDALQFGHLALADLPSDLHEKIRELLASDLLLEAAVSTSSEESLSSPTAHGLFRELRDNARNDAAMPEWLGCDDENVIVTGLRADTIESETGLNVQAVRRTFPGLEFQFPIAKVDVHIELSLIHI